MEKRVGNQNVEAQTSALQARIDLIDFIGEWVCPCERDRLPELFSLLRKLRFEAECKIEDIKNENTDK